MSLIPPQPPPPPPPLPSQQQQEEKKENKEEKEEEEEEKKEAEQIWNITVNGELYQKLGVSFPASFTTILSKNVEKHVLDTYQGVFDVFVPTISIDNKNKTVLVEPKPLELRVFANANDADPVWTTSLDGQIDAVVTGKDLIAWIQPHTPLSPKSFFFFDFLHGNTTRKGRRRGGWRGGQKERNNVLIKGVTNIYKYAKKYKNKAHPQGVLYVVMNGIVPPPPYTLSVIGEVYKKLGLSGKFWYYPTTEDDLSIDAINKKLVMKDETFKIVKPSIRLVTWAHTIEVSPKTILLQVYDENAEMFLDSVLFGLKEEDGIVTGNDLIEFIKRQKVQAKEVPLENFEFFRYDRSEEVTKQDLVFLQGGGGGVKVQEVANIYNYANAHDNLYVVIWQSLLPTNQRQEPIIGGVGGGGGGGIAIAATAALTTAAAAAATVWWRKKRGKTTQPKRVALELQGLKKDVENLVQTIGKTIPPPFSSPPLPPPPVTPTTIPIITKTQKQQQTTTTKKQHLLLAILISLGEDLEGLRVEFDDMLGEEEEEEEEKMEEKKRKAYEAKHNNFKQQQQQQQQQQTNEVEVAKEEEEWDANKAEEEEEDRKNLKRDEKENILLRTKKRQLLETDSEKEEEEEEEATSDIE